VRLHRASFSLIQVHPGNKSPEKSSQKIGIAVGSRVGVDVLVGIGEGVRVGAVVFVGLGVNVGMGVVACSVRVAKVFPVPSVAVAVAIA